MFAKACTSYWKSKYFLISFSILTPHQARIYVGAVFSCLFKWSSRLRGAEVGGHLDFQVLDHLLVSLESSRWSHIPKRTGFGICFATGRHYHKLFVGIELPWYIPQPRGSQGAENSLGGCECPAHSILYQIQPLVDSPGYKVDVRMILVLVVREVWNVIFSVASLPQDKNVPVCDRSMNFSFDLHQRKAEKTDIQDKQWHPVCIS